MPDDPSQRCCEDRRAEDDPERGLSELAARWYPRELSLDEFEVVGLRKSPRGPHRPAAM